MWGCKSHIGRVNSSYRTVVGSTHSSWKHINIINACNPHVIHFDSTYILCYFTQPPRDDVNLHSNQSVLLTQPPLYVLHTTSRKLGMPL